MLYQSVDNITRNIDKIPEHLRGDVFELITQVSRYMLKPLKLGNGKTVYVSACKYDQILRYIEFFNNIADISKVYLVGSALTDECRDKSDLDFLVVIKDSVDKDIFIRDTAFEEIGYDDYIVISESEWNAYCAFPQRASTFYRNVLQKGELIHDSSVRLSGTGVP